MLLFKLHLKKRQGMILFINYKAHGSVKGDLTCYGILINKTVLYTTLQARHCSKELHFGRKKKSHYLKSLKKPWENPPDTN